MELFNGYTPQATIFEGLINRACTIWSDYQGAIADSSVIPTMEISPLCGYCPFVADCPKFEAEEVRELEESVEILTELQFQQKNLEKDISIRKRDLMALVSARGPIKAKGRLLQKATRTRKTLDTNLLTDFLKEYEKSLSDFQKTTSYSFLEIKKAA